MSTETETTTTTETPDILENQMFSKAADAATALLLHTENLDPELQGEAFSHLKDMKGGAFGIMFMQVMGANVDPDLERIGHHNKAFWVEVAEALGPDWLHMLKHVAAFMSKVDEF